MKSGSLNFLEPSWPLQACNGVALLFFLSIYASIYKTDRRLFLGEIFSMLWCNVSSTILKKVRMFDCYTNSNKAVLSILSKIGYWEIFSCEPGKSLISDRNYIYHHQYPLTNCFFDTFIKWSAKLFMKVAETNRSCGTETMPEEKFDTPFWNSQPLQTEQSTG